MSTTVASLKALFGADTSGFDSGLAHVKGGMEGASRSVSGGMKSMGDSMTKAGMALAPMAAGFTALGYSGLNTASNFESAMTEISARTGLVGDDLKMISDLSLQMGADTIFSAQQSAEAFLQLLSSGQTAEQAIATLPTVLDLAAASGEDLGFTADSLTDIMAAFNLEISDSTMVADALAQAAGASSADIASLAHGFANVGPVARVFGLDVEKTAAILAVLSENGIKGAEAGTALKSMLLNMTRDTEEVQGAWNELGTSFYDAEGNARPLEAVLIDIKAGMEGMPVEQQNQLLQALAGSYGIVALNALMGDLSISDMTASMEGQTSAAEVAAAKMGTFEGSVDSLKGSIETLQIQAFTPFMKNVLQPLIDDHLIPAANAAADWAEENPDLASSIMSVGGGVILLSGGMMILGPLLRNMGTIVGGLTTGLMAFGGVFTIVGVLLAAYATNFGGFRDNIDDIRTDLEEGDIDGAIGNIGEALIAVPLGIAQELGKALFGWDEARMKAGLDAWKNMPGYLDGIGQGLSHIDFGLLRELANLTGGNAPTANSNAVGAAADIIKQQYPGVPSGGGTGTPWYDPSNYTTGDFMGSYKANEPVLVGTGAQPELFDPGGRAGMHYPAGTYGGDSEPSNITIEVDGETLLNAVLRAAGRRNIRLVAGG